MAAPDRMIAGIEYRVSTNGRVWGPWAPLPEQLVFTRLYLPEYFEFRQAAEAGRGAAVVVRPEPVALPGLVSGVPDTS